MIKLKQLLSKYWMYITFMISFIIDAQYGILEELIISPFWVNVIKGLGASILAYKTNKGLSSTSVFSKDEDLEDIGGGGIKNPKP